MNLLTPDEIKDVITAAYKRKGYYYCWPDESNSYSGKDLPGAKYPDTYDCSGLVTSSVYEGTKHRIDRRSTWNAQRLFHNCSRIEKKDLQPGDLVFYGANRDHVTHVMMWTGSEVYGSSGGDHRTLTPEIAHQMNASVKGYSSELYRHDFICFGRLITNED
jgi:cell wall-associated NlpC family hydrolase